MNSPFGIKAVRNELKRLSVFIDEAEMHASFQPSDCPFVDNACECIQHGGEVEHIALASLLHHIAENLQS